MKKEDIHLWDVRRILFGEAPAEFLVEVFVRTVLIYIVLLITIRLMGKRMSGQLTIAEMAVMVTLGAIVSPAMQIPNIGLLQGALILLLAFIFQRGLNYLEFKHYRLEKLNHGEIVMLVKDGTIRLDELTRAKLSRQQLFAVLRNEGIFNLGEVERVYLESFGSFSIYENKEPKPGLSLLPPDDGDIQGYEKGNEEQLMVCKSCGHVADKTEYEKECTICLSTEWMGATVSA